MNFDYMTNFLKHLVDEVGIPTVDCHVFYKGNKVYNYSYGLTDGKNPITPQHTYNLYSVSKVITCTAALQLLEQGKYILTDPLYDYFPEFKDMYIKKEVTSKDEGLKIAQGQKVSFSSEETELVKAKNPILIKDLFNMSAGFNYDGGSKTIKEILKRDNGKFPTVKIAEALSKEPISYEPGEHWGYSLAHDMVGAFIERVSGMSFGEYLKKNIFEPLDMKSFRFKCNEMDFEKMANQYSYDYETKTAHEIQKQDNGFCIGEGYESGGAGLSGSAEDYAKFVRAMSLGGVSPNGEQIITRDTIDLMRTDFLAETARPDFNWSQLKGYGYGLGVRTHINKSKSGGLSPIGEFGWGGAAGAYVMIDVENQVGVYYAQHMLNNLEPYVHPRLRNITYACLGR